MNRSKRILIVAATGMELNAVRAALVDSEGIDFAELGVGILSTAYRLSVLLEQNSYQWVLCVGIAGTFVPELQLGSVALVQCEQLDDLSHTQYIPGFEGAFGKGLIAPNQFPFEEQKLLCVHASQMAKKMQCAVAKSVTTSFLVKTIALAQLRRQFYQAEIENMEGAAFFYVCLMKKINFLQLRSISNQVGETDKAKWNIPLALKNLAPAAKECTGLLR